MKIREQVTKHPDGRISVKTVFPLSVWSLIEALAKGYQVNTIQALRIFLSRIGDAVESGSIDYLGTDVAKAIRGLRLENKLGPEGLPPIDFSILHRSAKTKSGFVGVYANGQGFRAMGESQAGGPQIYIGTYQSAEQAAWARYLHYQKHDFAYGDKYEAQQALLKELNDRVKNDPATFGSMTEDEIVAWIEAECQWVPSQRSVIERIYSTGLKYGSYDGTKKPKEPYVPPRIDPKIAAITGAVIPYEDLKRGKEDE